MHLDNCYNIIMTEFGEGETGGLRGLWNKFTGQSAKIAKEDENRRIAEEQRIKVRREQQKIEEKEAGKKAEETRKLITKITTLPKAQLPENLDINQEIDNIEAGVTARSIYGKFPPEFRMKDMTFQFNKFNNDFTEFGDADQIGFSSGSDEKTPLTAFYAVLSSYTAQEKLKDLGKKHFLSAINIPGTEDSILSYFIAHPYFDGGNRPCPTVAINFRMNQHLCVKLLELTRKDPESAEKFLQKAASGFESTPDNKSIPRVKSDKIVLVNFGNFKSDYFNPYINLTTNKPTLNKSAIGSWVWPGINMITEDMLQNSNNQIERYNYSSPHGVTDPRGLQF